MIKIKNGVLRVEEDQFDYVQFGCGDRSLVVIPGLGDGIVTVKNKALPGVFMFHDYVRRFKITIISRKNNLEEGSTTYTMAQDQAKAMKELGIEHAEVIGVSEGGMIAQHLAADFPELVDKLVLAVTIPRANEMLNDNCTRWITLAEEGNYKELVRDINKKAHPEVFFRKMKKSIPLIAFMSRKMDKTRFRIQAQACMTHDAYDRLEAIEAPVLIIGAKEDETLGIRGSYELAREIWDCKLKCFEEHGHAVYEDEPEFHHVVLRFLR